MTVVQLTVAHPWFTDGAALFDEYRQHYGANPAPEAVESWMRDQILTDRMRLYAAVPDGRARGICAVSVVPASLTLRTVWLVRDLYVVPFANPITGGESANTVYVATTAPGAAATPR